MVLGLGTSANIVLDYKLMLSDVLILHRRRKTDGWTPLHLATMFGKVAVAKALLRAGADAKLRAELQDLDTVNAEQMARKLG